jgi:hypothetical protein
MEKAKPIFYTRFLTVGFGMGYRAKGESKLSRWHIEKQDLPVMHIFSSPVLRAIEDQCDFG